jgi:nitroreductase
MLLTLTPDELLSTTRSVRKRLDFSRPVEPEVVRECLALALQAPNFGNGQGWRWLVVTEPTKRQALAACYRRGYDRSRQPATPHAAAPDHLQASDQASDPQRVARERRRRASSDYLAEHLQDAPVLVIPCYLGRAEGEPTSRQASRWGSMLPAAWSFMLALRARLGLGVDHEPLGVRTRRRRDRGDSLRDRHANGPLARRLHHRDRLSARRARAT